MKPKETIKHEVDNIATALSYAFIRDPLFNAFFPHNPPHCPLSYYTFRFLVRHTIENGELTLTHIHNTCVGAALWLPSESVKRSFADEVRCGGIDMLRHQGIAALLRQMSASKQMAEKHTALLPMPHYYLSVLGLRPEAQGMGLATQLITPMLERADSEAKPCYLDTHNEANVNLYRHYGFDVVDQDVMKGLAVKHWVMIRSPR